MWQVSDGIPHEIPHFSEPVEFGASEGPIAFVCLGCEERQARGEEALVTGQHVFLRLDDSWVDARFERAGEPAEAETVEHPAVTAGSHRRDIAIVRRYDTGEIDSVPYGRVKIRRTSGSPGYRTSAASIASNAGSGQPGRPLAKAATSD